MIPIDDCSEDVLQQWPMFFDVNCRLPPAIDGCFEVAASCSSSTTAA